MTDDTQTLTVFRAPFKHAVGHRDTFEIFPEEAGRWRIRNVDTGHVWRAYAWGSAKAARQGMPGILAYWGWEQVGEWEAWEMRLKPPRMVDELPAAAALRKIR